MIVKAMRYLDVRYNELMNVLKFILLSFWKAMA